MAADDHGDGLLWMFRRSGAGRGSAEADPDNAIYRLFKNTRNPFVQRAIAPGPVKAKRTSQELAGLAGMLESQRIYRVGPQGEAAPFRRRALKHPPPEPSREPRYLEPARLTGDLGRLPFLVDGFFQGVLARLREDPNSFFTVIQELTALLRANNVRIRLYEAYREFQDWDDLMDTLAEISRYPSLETFDLFCSALLVYHDLVHPPPASSKR
jgi:hypothetical protein